MFIKTNNKPIAVFDLDDTLINLRDELYDQLCQEYGKNNIPHWMEWQTEIADFIGITPQELADFCQEREIFKTIKPFFFSRYVLKDLSERGYHVIILTAREGFVPNAYNETEKYLIENDLYYDELIISGHGQNKSDYLKYDNIHFFVDDQEKNCQQLAESGKVNHVFLYALPRNKYCTNFIRIHNHFQIYPHIGLE